MMMTSLLGKRHPALVGFGFIAGFLFVAPFVNKEFLAILLNCLTITVGIAVVVTYYSSAYNIIRFGKSDRTSKLIIGITLSFLGLVMNRLGLMFWPAYPGSFMFSLVGYVVFLSGILHLTPQYDRESNLTTLRSWLVVAIVIVSAFIMAYGIYFFDPKVFDVN